MTTGQLIIVCLAALGLAAIARADVLLAAALRPGGPAPAPIGTAIVVHTRDARSLQGTVASDTGLALVLRDCGYLQDGVAVPMGGRVTVPADNIGLVQILDEPQPGR